MVHDANLSLWNWLRLEEEPRQAVNAWLHHPNADGRGVRVAIIDTGIDEQLLMQRNSRLGQTVPAITGGIFQKGLEAPLPYSGQQSAPHGTTVADIVLKMAPAVQLFSADIFGPRGIADLEALIQAIYYATEQWKCHILNISLGVTEQRLQTAIRKQQLARAVEDCYQRGILIVAAAHNDHPTTRSYPALFAPAVLSVTVGPNDPWRVVYTTDQDVEFGACGRGQVGPFAEEPATSWAAPHLTGLAARLLSLHPELRPFELKTLLYWWAQHEKGTPPPAYSPRG